MLLPLGGVGGTALLEYLIPDCCKKECRGMSASQPASSFKTMIGFANLRWRSPMSAARRSPFKDGPGRV
jgi:hypothetical protein